MDRFDRPAFPEKLRRSNTTCVVPPTQGVLSRHITLLYVFAESRHRVTAGRAM